MAIPVKTVRMRLALDISKWSQTPVDLITSASPTNPNGADLQFELALSYGTLVSDAQLVDLSNWASITISLKDASDPSGNAYWSSVIPAQSLNNSLTYANWIAGTDQHCIVPVSSAVNNVLLTTTSSSQVFVLDVTASTITTDQQATAIAVVAGGSGYHANDVVSVIGGTQTQLAAIQIDTVDGFGAVLTAHIVQGGQYQATPSNAVSVNGGNGTSATFNVTWGKVASKVLPLAVFPITVTDSGLQVGAPNTVSTPTYYTAAQCDARFMLAADLTAKANVSGATFTGALVLAASQMTGATGFYATTKTYVDAGDAATAAASVPNTGVSSIAGAKTFTSLLTASAGLTVTGTTTLDTSLSGILKAINGTISANATTSDLVEGSNLYFTQPRVLATLLSGYVATSGTISSTDTVLSALQKIGYFAANAFTGAATWPVASQSAMLALSAKQGDFAIRADINQVYVLGSGSPTLLGSWALLLNPVTSVNSLTGAITLTTDNVSEGNTLYFTNARADARITAQYNVANGLCPLDGSSLVPWANLPPLTGYVSGAGTITSSDTILSAIQKLNGNIASVLGVTGGTISGILNFSGTSNPGLIVNQLSTTQIGGLSTAGANYGNIVYDTTANQLKALIGGSWVSLVSNTSYLPLSAGSGNKLTAELYFNDGLAANIAFGNIWSCRTSGGNAQFDILNSSTVVFSCKSNNDVTTANGWYDVPSAYGYKLNGNNLLYLSGAAPVLDLGGSFLISTESAFAKMTLLYAGNGLKIDTFGHVEFTTELHTASGKVIDSTNYYYDSSGNQLLSSRQSPGFSGGASGATGWTDATAQNDFNNLISALKTHGLIHY